MKFFKISIFLLIGTLCSIQPCNAKVVHHSCIKKINEVMPFIRDLKGNIVAIIDWDQTISNEEGKYNPREGGEEGTIAILKNSRIKKYGYSYLQQD